MSAVAPRVTLQQLADEVGVSRATVSNAYNRPDQLSADLRTRILSRAAELGFAGPDPVARGLRRGRVGAVGVLVDQGLSYAFSDPVVVLVLDGLARELQADGTGLLLHAAAPGRGAEAVHSAAVDGWIVMSVPADHPALAAATGQGRPMVVIDQPLLPAVSHVGIDDAQGARTAAEHLLQLGHREISVLTLPLHGDGRSGPAGPERRRLATNRVMAVRIDSVEQALLRAGAPAARVVECPANDPDAGATGAAVALGHAGTTALLCLSDQLALGALRLARDRQLDVPGRLSVIGFDDAPGARTAYPPLTTIGQPLRERGVAAAGLLRALLAGRPALSPPLFATSLVVRGSTGPARAT